MKTIKCNACDLQITALTGSSKIINPSTGGNLSITGSITDSSGQAISWTLTTPDGKTTTGSGTSVSATWDGKDASGKVVEPGSYSATLTAQTADGQCTATKTLPITVTEAEDGQCGLYVQFGSSAHMANGNLSHSQNLFSSKSNSLPASLSLYYNSLDPRNGSLGLGWSHSYDISLKEKSDGSVLINEGDWKYQYYTLSNGVYTGRAGNYSTLVKNSNGSFTLTSKDGQVSLFAANGSLTSIADRNGNTQTFTYSNGNLASVTDPAGHSVTFAYDAANHLTSATAPSGNAYSFAVGATLTSVTQPDGGLWQYSYDDKAFMLSKTDPVGNVTTYAYDDKHRVVSSTDPEGKTRSVNYPQGTDTIKSTTFTEKDGGTWSYRYDTEKGYLLAKTDPQSGTTSYIYDANGNQTATTAPDGTTTSSVYDAQGNMTATTDAAGRTTSYTYDGFGQITGVTDPLGGKTVYAYDAQGNLTGFTDASGSTTAYQYDSRGNVTKITDAKGSATSFTYDQSGNLATTTDPAGATTTYGYDAAGNVTQITDAKGATTRLFYDSGNRVVKTVDSLGNATTSSYDSNGNKISYTDANGAITRYEYNSQNQLIKTIDALGNTTMFSYNGAGCGSCGGGGVGKLTALTDANGNATNFGYDQLGRLTGETDPLGNVTSYAYDSKGNLTAKTDANGNTITYSYDANGKLLKKSYPDNTEESFTYNAKGNLLTAANKNISYTFTYDAAGRMLSAADAGGKTVSYGYDAAGNRTTLTYPDGFSTSSTYDTGGRLAKITTSTSQAYTFTYDNLGRRTKLGYPNGASASYGYDTSGRLLSLAHKGALGLTIDSFTYTYDKVGNRLTKQQPLLTTAYTYDAIYRLTQAKPSLPWETTEQYGYDNVGNRLTGPITALARQYNQANQLTEETIPAPGILQELFGASAVPTGKAQLVYDKNGNLIKKTETTALPNTPVTTGYSYDFENRLTQVDIQFGSATITTSFSYDPLGRRIGKKTTGKACLLSGTDSRTYVYDGQNIILENRDTNILGADFTGVSRYLHGPGTDEPLALTRNTTTWYYHADGLGSVIALSNKYGIVVEKYAYDSFGNQKPAIHLIGQPYTYTGREWDRETGLYYYRARYYDSKEGRFTQKDPYGFAGGINLYAYVSNNPVKFADSQGLAPNQPFDSPNAAAIDAIDYYIETSNKTNREYGGWIYKMKNKCKWSYAEGMPGSKDGKYIRVSDFKEPPQGSEKVRMWHTHTGDGYNIFWFSTDDTLAASSEHKVLYLGIGDGRIKLYDPNAPSWLSERSVR